MNRLPPSQVPPAGQAVHRVPFQYSPDTQVHLHWSVRVAFAGTASEHATQSPVVATRSRAAAHAGSGFVPGAQWVAHGAQRVPSKKAPAAHLTSHSPMLNSGVL
jgi:hypothetical protein